jgi:hypothetical protein
MQVNLDSIGASFIQSKNNQFWQLAFAAGWAIRSSEFGAILSSLPY